MQKKKVSSAATSVVDFFTKSHEFLLLLELVLIHRVWCINHRKLDAIYGHLPMRRP